MCHVMSHSPGGILRDWRENTAELSRPQLAARVGVSVATLIRLEKATTAGDVKTKPVMLRRVAKAMGPDDGARFLDALGIDHAPDDWTTGPILPGTARQIVEVFNRHTIAALAELGLPTELLTEVSARFEAALLPHDTAERGRE